MCDRQPPGPHCLGCPAHGGPELLTINEQAIDDPAPVTAAEGSVHPHRDLRHHYCRGKVDVRDGPHTGTPQGVACRFYCRVVDGDVTAMALDEFSGFADFTGDVGGRHRAPLPAKVWRAAASRSITSANSAASASSA